MKKLSIVTVCYNSEKTIERCINSIVPQLNSEVEYLVIDGNSKDNTVKILEKYNELRFISEKDSGIYNAMNKAIKLAEGEFILFINSDDCLFSFAVDNILKYINDDVDCLYGDIRNVIYINNDKYYRDYRAEDIKNLNKRMITSHQSLLMRKSMMLELKGFNENYKIAADWDLFIRTKINNYKIKYIPVTVAEFTLGGTCTNNTFVKEKHLIRKNNKLYKFIDLYYFVDMLDILKKYRNVIAKFILGKKYDDYRIKHKNFVKE